MGQHVEDHLDRQAYVLRYQEHSKALACRPCLAVMIDMQELSDVLDIELGKPQEEAWQSSLPPPGHQRCAQSNGRGASRLV